MQENQSQCFIHKNLTLIEQVHGGNQARVFIVKCNVTNQRYILKIYNRSSYHWYLNEKEVLKKLVNQIGFPKLYSTKTDSVQCELLIELLGPSLKEKLTPLMPFSNKNKRYFYSLMLQLVEHIQTLHSLHFVHADLKLQNLCFDLTNQNTLFVIDFGSTFCYTTFDNEHKVNHFDRRFTGNFLFSSMHICRGSSPSRRDDIESILYIIVHCTVDSKLPWSHFGKFYNEKNLPKLRYARSTQEAVEEVY